MFRRIDPALPVVWSGSDSVRIGIDPPRVSLDRVDGTMAMGLGELMRGTSDARLGSVVGDAERARRLLDAVGEVLEPSPTLTLPRVAVVGSGTAVDTIARVLSGAARSVGLAASSGDLVDESFDMIVLVSDFVVSPVEVQPWLGRDSRHGVVVFGEAAVTVGPVVTPGHTACVRCVELERCDLDPAWPAIAPQVWGRRSPVSTTALATHAAGVLLDLWSGGGNYSVRIDAVTLERLTTPHRTHPQCGCVSLPELTR